MDLQSLLFSFSGRINRAKYWFVVLINVIVPNVPALFLIGALGESEIDPSSGLPSAASPGIWVAGVILLAIVVFSTWTTLASSTKRLHDREKSGWWVLVFWFGPAILIGIAGAVGDAVGSVFVVAAIALGLWGFVEIACLSGTTGPNAYGPDPLEAAAVAT